MMSYILTSKIAQLQENNIKNTDIFCYGFDSFFTISGYKFTNNKKLFNLYKKYNHNLIIKITNLYDEQKYKYYGEIKKPLYRKSQIQFKLYNYNYMTKELTLIKNKKNKIHLNINDINDYYHVYPYNMDKLDISDVIRKIKLKKIIDKINEKN